MNASAITVKKLCDSNTEKTIREQVESRLKNHVDFRVSVLGSSENDNWEIKVQNSQNQKSWVATLTMPENQTVERAVQYVMDGIAAVK